MKTLRRLLTIVTVTLMLASCATPTPIVQTVEVPVEVTREVEVKTEVEVEVTREVKVETEVQVAVTPAPIGGELILYGCMFDPEEQGVLFTTFRDLYGVDVNCLDMSSGEASMP